MVGGSASGRWDARDLERRLCKALDVAARAVPVLAVEGYSDVSNPEEVLRPAKVVAETAVLLLAAARATPACKSVLERVAHVAQLLRPHAQGDRVRALVCMEPALALDHCMAHVCLTQLGYLDEDLDGLLAQSLTSGAAAARERLPHRELEQHWLRQLHRGSANIRDPDERSLLRRCALCTGLDPFSSSRDDVYAFTHALMYVTDLGSLKPRLPRSQGNIVGDAEAALAQSLAEDDYDLGAEVLLAWPMLGARWTPAATFGFRVLTSVEDEAGFLPALSIRLDRYRALVGEARTRYALASAYHTVYVMGLLCAAALGSGWLPAREVPHASRARGAAARILDIIGSANPPPRWRECFGALDPPQQDCLGPLLMAMGLRQAAASRELRTIKALLEVAVEFGVVGGPAPRHGAELLRRAARLGTTLQGPEL